MYTIKLLRELLEKQYIELSDEFYDSKIFVNHILSYIMKNQNQLNANIFAIMFYVMA